MIGWFLSGLIRVSVTVAVMGAVLMAATPVLNRRLALGRKCSVWLLLALRLALPLSPPRALFTVQFPRLWSPEPVPADTGGVSPVPRELTAAGGGADPLQVIFLVWLIVAAAILARELTAYLTFRRRALRWSLPATDDLTAACDVSASALGVGAPPPVRISREVRGPMLIGIFRPVILLPHAAYGRSALELILCHELAHYRRRDTWLKLLLLIARAVHWFNPVVHLMAGRAERDIELACDEAVLGRSGGVDRRAYGALLLDHAVTGRYPSALIMGLRPGRRQLTERIGNMMTKKKSHGGGICLTLAAAALLLLGASVGLAPAALAAEEAASAPALSDGGVRTRPTAAELRSGQPDLLSSFEEKLDKDLEETVQYLIVSENRHFWINANVSAQHYVIWITDADGTRPVESGDLLSAEDLR